MRNTQETQPEMVETEFYGIPVESRTLPAGVWTDGRTLAYANQAPKNIVQNII